MVENIFDHYPQAIAHPINCIGICHDSLSNKIKKAWPEYFWDYSRACIRKKLVPYQTYYYKINTLFGTEHILSMTIRNNWQEKLKKENMQIIIESLIAQCNNNKISVLAVPIIEGIPNSWLEMEIEKSIQKNSINVLNKIFLFPN